MGFISTIKKPMQGIDKKILEKFPILWETKVHWVFYLTLLTHLFLLAFVLLFQIAPDNSSTIDVVYGISFIPIIIAIGAWLTFVVRFNIANENGKVKKRMEIPKFIALFISLGLFFSLSYTLPCALAFNKSQQTDWQQLRTEIDALNEGSPYFVDHDLYDNTEYRDGSNFRCIKEELYKEDFFDYQSFSIKKQLLLGIKSDEDLQASYQDVSEATIKRKIADYIKFNEKYGNELPYAVDSVYQIHLRKCLYFKSSEDQLNQYVGPKLTSVMTYGIARDLMDLVDIITYDFSFFDSDIFWVYFIVMLLLSTVVLLLKNLRWQRFILLPVFFTPFAILSTVLLVLFNNHHEEESLMSYYLLCFFLCVIWGSKGAFKPTYSWFSAICLMMAQLCVPFLPSYLLGYFSVIHVAIPGLIHNDDSEYYQIADGAMKGAMLVGFLLYLGVLPLFKMLQVRYCALPRAK